MLEGNFLKLLAEFTAGDPMREGVLWTNLSRCEISRRLAEMGTPTSWHIVRKLLKKNGLGQRKARKKNRWAHILTATLSLKKLQNLKSVTSPKAIQR
ncbi:MAG: hypothetical protein QX197_09450 [Methylococcaceae bacterium]